MTTRSAHFALGAAALLSLLLNACGSEAPSPPSAQDIQDDFSQEFCRFGSMGGSTSRGYGCIDGEFRAWIDNDEAPYDFIAASAGESMGDVRLEVDVRFAQDAEGGAYLICRGSQAGGSFYLLRLAAEGWVEITDFLDGEEQTAHMMTLPADALKPGWNRLRADCIGRDLSMYLNGELVLEREIEGEAYGPGDIALGAGGGSEGLSDVYFDNLVVGAP